jgi:hypothetical protein
MDNTASLYDQVNYLCVHVQSETPAVPCDEISHLYFSPNIVKLRMVRWMGHESHMREIRNADKILV